MKQHSVLGSRLFVDKQSELDEAAGLVALDHHERWDGNGYPGHVNVLTGEPRPGYAPASSDKARGKIGREAHLFGRIVAIADVYDALCSKRVYKEAWDEREALDLIERGAGSQFDPDLVEVFFSCLDVMHSIRDRYPDEED